MPEAAICLLPDLHVSPPLSADDEAHIEAIRTAVSDACDLLIYLGDRWNANGPGSVGNSSYVWLPLVRDRSSATGFSMLSLGNGTGDGSWRVRDYVLSSEETRSCKT